MGDPEQAVGRLDEHLDELVALFDDRLILASSTSAIAAGLSLDVAWTARVEEHPGLSIQHVHGTRTDRLLGLTVPPGWGVSGRAFVTASPYSVDDYFCDRGITHHFDDEISEEGLRSLVGVPIVVDGRVVAVLAGGSRSPGSFGDVAIDQLQTATRRTSIALQSSDRARSLARAAVQEDRQSQAASLHDSVGAMLFAIQAGVQDLASSLAGDGVRQAQAKQIEAHAVAAARALRESLRAMSVAPTDLALEVEMSGDLRAFERRAGITTSFVVLQREALDVPRAHAETLVGALREALLNVEKHSGARAVVVTLSRAQEVVRLTVTDDGAGLPDAGSADAGPGLRLPEQRRRFARLGGVVGLYAPEDGGVVFRGSLPA